MTRPAWSHVHRVRSRTRELCRMQCGALRVGEIQRCRCGNVRLASLVKGELLFTEWCAPDALPLLSPIGADAQTDAAGASPLELEPAD